jgi:hypothetical protein
MPVRHKHCSHSIKGRCQPAAQVSAQPPAGWLDLLPRNRRAYILGAGPNGIPFHKLDPDGLKIALNSAIVLPWRFDIWMVFDYGATQYPWYKTHTSAHKVFGTDLAKVSKPEVTFPYQPTMHSVDEFRYGVLHGGASIAGCAIQLCYWLGCEHITLVGIDQFGSRHFDGTIGAPKHTDRVWSTVKLLEKIIRITTAHGITVDSLSRTKLSVPTVKH